MDEDELYDDAETPSAEPLTASQDITAVPEGQTPVLPPDPTMVLGPKPVIPRPTAPVLPGSQGLTPGQQGLHALVAGLMAGMGPQSGAAGLGQALTVMRQRQQQQAMARYQFQNQQYLQQANQAAIQQRAADVEYDKRAQMYLGAMKTASDLYGKMQKAGQIQTEDDYWGLMTSLSTRLQQAGFRVTPALMAQTVGPYADDAGKTDIKRQLEAYWEQQKKNPNRLKQDPSAWERDAIQARLTKGSKTTTRMTIPDAQRAIGIDTYQAGDGEVNFAPGGTKEQAQAEDAAARAEFYKRHKRPVNSRNADDMTELMELRNAFKPPSPFEDLRGILMQQQIAQGSQKLSGAPTPYEAEQRKKVIETVMANPAAYDDLTPTVKADIMGDLAARGFAGFGKQLPQGAVDKIAQSKSAILSLRDLRQVLQENEQYIGPIAGLQALNPYSDARKAQAKIDLVKQRVGKALEGGVLRKEDEEKYKIILATLRDEPTTAIYKVDNIIAELERDLTTFIDEQRASGRRVQTPSLPPASTPAPAAPAKSPVQEELDRRRQQIRGQ